MKPGSPDKNGERKIPIANLPDRLWLKQMVFVDFRNGPLNEPGKGSSRKGATPTGQM